MLPLIKKKSTVTYKIEVKSASYKFISGSASKLFETVTIPSLKNSSFTNTDKQTQGSRLAHYSLKTSRHCVDSEITGTHFAVIHIALIQIRHCNCVMWKTDRDLDLQFQENYVTFIR